MERGTLCTKFALAGLALSSLSSFISFCKKWYIRDEVCGLTKKRNNNKITRRERPKSAPYLRLKNIQGTTIGKIWKKIFFSKKKFDFFSKKSIF